MRIEKYREEKVGSKDRGCQFGEGKLVEAGTAPEIEKGTALSER